MDSKKTSTARSRLRSVSTPLLEGEALGGARCTGKTVSLYTCLNILNKPGVNISTAEDPAEINLPGINQVNVNDKAGLTFAAALKFNNFVAN